MSIQRYLQVFSMLVSSLFLANTLMASGYENEHDRTRPAGAVYTMTNAVDGNEVLMYMRGPKGALIPGGAFATGGLGSGSGLGNQGGLILSHNNRWLFAVNAGSNEISVFAIRHNRLVLRDKIDSGGIRPVSVTVDRSLLYVLNAGSDNVSGFVVGRRGKLSPLADSTRALSGTGTAPAQIQFDPEGEVLVVTEKATNLIDTFVVGEHGLASNAITHASVGATPFGFAFDKRGRLFVSEAAGGAPDASSVSSYRVSEQGNLGVISSAVPTTETAACWVAITGNGRFAYTTNTGSSSLSGFRIARNGSLSLLDADGRTGDAGSGSSPIDMAFSRNSRFLYALSAGDGSISAFRVKANGSLVNIQRVEGLPTTINGLAAH